MLSHFVGVYQKNKKADTLPNVTKLRKVCHSEGRKARGNLSFTSGLSVSERSPRHFVARDDMLT